MKRTFAAFVGLAGLVLAAPANAQSAAAGLPLYEYNCQSCHGTPPNLRDGAGSGAGNAAAIRKAITRNKGGMGYLSVLADTELSSIAAYLANPAAATAVSSADRVLNWAEAQFAAVLQGTQPSGTTGPYTYRCYTAPGLCIGIDSANVYLYELSNPGKGIYAIGTLSSYLGQAQSNGY